MELLNVIQLQGEVGRKSVTLADSPSKRYQIHMSGAYSSVNVILKTPMDLAKDVKVDVRVGGKMSLARSNGLPKKRNWRVENPEKARTHPNGGIAMLSINLSFKRYQR
jgi:hypothetical protein